MEHNQSRPHVVSLFFGIAIAVILFTVLATSLFFSKLPQPQATDPVLISQSQQAGYSYTEAAATQTVHNKALLLLVAVGTMTIAIITGIVIVGTFANRRVSQQIAQLDQYAALTKTAVHYQQTYAIPKQQSVRASRAYKSHH